MPDWLQQRALLSPEKTAIVCADASLTFTDLDRRASVLASRLLTTGAHPGDRVALLSANSAGFAEAAFGVSRAGLVLVPLNVRLTPAELAFQLGDCGASLVIVEDGREGSVRSLETARILSMSDLLAPGHAPADPAPAVPLDRLHSIIYTSGTTGRPKGAMLSFGNLAWNAFGSVLNLGLREDDRWLACMPLFHVGGLSVLIRGVIYGNTVVIHEAFGPERVNRALSEDRISIVSLVPTMLRRLLDLTPDEKRWPSLRCVLLGGGPIPPELVDECLRRGIPIAPTYGLTEAASQVATLAPGDAALKRGSAGKPLFPVDLRIESDDGRLCEAGEPGEIAVGGPTITSGYYNRPDQTTRALRGGRLHTGDFGYLDEDGYLYVLDRRDDLIVSGGENVYPAEVEAVLASHPAVLEAGVYAVPDREWGQAVVAAVSLAAGAVATEEDLRAYCRERLAGFKVPHRISFVAELPRNASGKLLRRELRGKSPP